MARTCPWRSLVSEGWWTENTDVLGSNGGEAIMRSRPPSVGNAISYGGVLRDSKVEAPSTFTWG